ncbi:CotY/CotZ family spore coat protein [Bacillaceae bacterium W0354]
MSCRGKEHSENCVCDILREIVAAQRDIVDECDVGCEQSIQDLLGDTTAPNNLDTVPVLLYCECNPFKGFGVKDDQNRTALASFYFRVRSVDEDCCAVLELLRDPADTHQNFAEPTNQKTANLRGTGICINVDLKCFCHVTCLPAIRALS